MITITDITADLATACSHVHEVVVDGKPICTFPMRASAALSTIIEEAGTTVWLWEQMQESSKRRREQEQEKEHA